MKKNVGNADAFIRLLVGVVIAATSLYFKSWWGWLAIIPFATAYFNVCPLYKILGISTYKRKIKVS